MNRKSSRKSGEWATTPATRRRILDAALECIAANGAAATTVDDICTASKGNSANCNFNVSGYRVPLVVVSPFTIPHYVSHTNMDYTAILKFIETRFGLKSLTQRDAAQPDMTEFFNFVDPPWATPPANVPAQTTTRPCYFSSFP